ncbi:MAG: EamA family transporter [Clostridia bacterium]|nr:EamA family transporter [Clostridia bacterium]
MISKQNKLSENSKLILSMLIFGTIGLVRKYIPYSSGMIAFVRGLTGALFLFVFHLLQKKRLSGELLKANGKKLCLSGVLLGANWILLFEAYRFTTISVATICYYMAPVFVILASPILFHEKLTLKKVICSLTAVFGMILVSGVTQTGFTGIKGALLGLSAAMLYAAVVIINKKMDALAADDRTIVQLGIAAAALLPYVLITDDLSQIEVNQSAILMLLVAGILHTGIAYALYFGSIQKIPAQTVALLSYLDPITAVLISAFLLKEDMSLLTFIGVLLVIGSTIFATCQKVEWKNKE